MNGAQPAAPTTAMLILNAVGIQATWFSTVLGAATGYDWIGVGVGLAVIMLHLLRAERPGSEARLVLLAGALGVVAEALLIGTDVAAYAGYTIVPGLPPVWLIVLWMAFATALNFCLGWLKSRPVSAAALGFAAGVAAYGGGARLGGMTLAEPTWVSLAIIGAVWALALPLLLQLATRWNGQATG